MTAPIRWGLTLDAPIAEGSVLQHLGGTYRVERALGRSPVGPGYLRRYVRDLEVERLDVTAAEVILVSVIEVER